MKWDNITWLNSFFNQDLGPTRFRTLRKNVFQNTVEIIKTGKYISVSGKTINLYHIDIENSQKETIFYPDTKEIDKLRQAESYQTRIDVIEADCLEITNLVQKMGYSTAVLNMADTYNPGGGVLYGSGAQEENIFRRSTAFTSLYQFIDYFDEYGVIRNANFSYPIPEESGGIYSPGIIVFRSSEKTGYYLLDNPFKINLISVAAISNPPLITDDGKLQIENSMVEPTKEKIRTILRIAKVNQHDALVLSAFGCGAFANPPEHMAMLFNHVLNEVEFRNTFRLIVFAIIDDHNSHKHHNPNGNVLPFQVEFNKILNITIR